MQPFLRLLLLTLAVVPAAACSLGEDDAAAAARPPQEVDLVPPEVVLPVLDPTADERRFLALSDLRGEKLVVHFFASWCPECREQLASWQRAVADIDQVRTVVVACEQHPERAAVFLASRGIDALLLADPLDLYEVPYVPITLLVDEQGRARHAPPANRPEEVQEALDWLLAARSGPPPVRLETADSARLTDVEALYRRAAAEGAAAEDWRRYAQALFLSGDARLLTRAIEAWETLLALEPGDAEGFVHFRLGTAYRARYDSPARRPGDFAAAVEHWHRAFTAAPNNWIFRRRLQQYGPGLGRPFAFYDWLPAAAASAPVELTASLDPAETAPPAELPPQELLEPPDPAQGLTRDRVAGFTEPDPQATLPEGGEDRLGVDTLLVPPVLPPGGHARVRLALEPADGFVWNPRAPGVSVWLPAPVEWRTAPPLVTAGGLPATPDAARVVDLEVRAPATAQRGRAALPGYLVYSLCRGTAPAARAVITPPAPPQGADQGAAPAAAPAPAADTGSSAAAQPAAPELTWQSVRLGECSVWRRPLPLEVPVVPGAPSLERRALP